nr:RecName: Full=Scolopendra 4610.56 Da toxin; Contains: RecName: Full=Scolopendra 3464.34 Da toxin [Scolopendra viridicornis nigra]
SETDSRKEGRMGQKNAVIRQWCENDCNYAPK